MSSAAMAHRPSSGNLYEVVDVILDKGLVVDAFVRVSLVGIELLTVDARVVIASVDTYLHFAEAVDRLDLSSTSQPRPLPELFGETSEEVTEGKTKGAIEGGVEKIRNTFGVGDEDESGSS